MKLLCESFAGTSWIFLVSWVCLENGNLSQMQNSFGMVRWSYYIKLDCTLILGSVNIPYPSKLSWFNCIIWIYILFFLIALMFMSVLVQYFCLKISCCSRTFESTMHQDEDPREKYKAPKDYSFAGLILSRLIRESCKC